MLVMFTALRHTPGMKKENGFTLIETLVAVSLVVILSASGLYRHNRDHQITRQRVGDRDCLVSSAVQGCEKDSPFVLLPLWPEVAIGEVTPSLGFYGLRDTAWAGRIRVQSRAGDWLIIVSDGGRIRMCKVSEGGQCR